MPPKENAQQSSTQQPADARQGAATGDTQRRQSDADPGMNMAVNELDEAWRRELQAKAPRNGWQVDDFKVQWTEDEMGDEKIRRTLLSADAERPNQGFNPFQKP
ncbi:MAG: hypothetical protein Q9227_004755 [Pyrenula ochraceoflavens]